ncbi:SPOR domain-containing protein [Paenibacillaceae bacterium WGS1546]|uniref:SPOR domain-containing protein n=1 Tax=Cohnella sp. WGS1546 TaxID=3366810 RepID=UPI00372D8193
MPSNARITIRFDPPAGTIRPKRPLVPAERKPSRDEGDGRAPAAAASDGDQGSRIADPEFVPWNSPYQEDIIALEQIIRGSKAADKHRPPAGSRERPKDDTADPPIGKLLRGEADPELGRYEADDYADGASVRGGIADNGWYDKLDDLGSGKETGPSWLRVVLTVAGALATGALFGYLALSLFTGEPLIPPKTGEGSPAPVQGPVRESNVPDREGSAAAPVSGGDGVSAYREVAADRYYVLQYGVFQSADGMKAAANELRSKGYSAATDESDGYRVYVAATSSKDEAELLAAQMTDTEVYIKTIGGEALRIAATADANPVADYVAASAQLIERLIALSGRELQLREPAEMGDGELAQWEEALRSWQTAASVMAEADGSVAADTATVGEALNSAAATLAEFNLEPTRERLWSIQTDAMKALFAEHRLRQALIPAGD